MQVKMRDARERLGRLDPRDDRSGTSTPRPVARSGWIRAKLDPSIRGARSRATTTSTASANFEDEWLRGGPVRRWVPKAYADRPIYVFETGGSTGVPKSRISIEDFRIDYEAFSDTLPDDAFPQGRRLADGRPQPARAGCGSPSSISRSTAAASASCSTSIPRWVIKLIKTRQDAMMPKLYKQHVIDQALTLLQGARPSSACSPRRSCSKPVREDLAEESRDHRHLLRRHRDDAAVPPLRRRRAAATASTSPRPTATR